MNEMTAPIDASSVDKASGGKKNRLFFMLAPFVVTLLLLLVPVPEGLQPYAWYYFAIFVGVIVGLILEPMPGAVIGLTGSWPLPDQSVGAVQPGRYGCAKI